MTSAGFLDTGVFIGFCFTYDRHHDPCRSYLENRADTLYTSDTVQAEYPDAKEKSSTRYSDAVRLHISDLRRSGLEGELGPTELNRAKTEILDRRNNLFDAIYELYEGLPQFIQYDELVERLEQLEHDIDALAFRRKKELDSKVQIWDPKDVHEDLRSQLSIHEPDLTICMEGHDLAANVDHDTELATANPTDFVYGGMRERNLELTCYSDVVDLSG